LLTSWHAICDNLLCTAITNKQHRTIIIQHHRSLLTIVITIWTTIESCDGSIGDVDPLSRILGGREDEIWWYAWEQGTVCIMSFRAVSEEKLAFETEVRLIHQTQRANRPKNDKPWSLNRRLAWVNSLQSQCALQLHQIELKNRHICRALYK
jgi:hypothetical protein